MGRFHPRARLPHPGRPCLAEHHNCLHAIWSSDKICNVRLQQVAQIDGPLRESTSRCSCCRVPEVQQIHSCKSNGHVNLIGNGKAVNVVSTETLLTGIVSTGPKSERWILAGIRDSLSLYC